LGAGFSGQDGEDMNATAETRPEADAGDAEQRARAQLRSAIERRDHLAGELQASEEASQKAFRRSVDLGSQIAEAEQRRRSPDRARVDSAVGDALVLALLDERDLPADETPSDEALGSLRAEHVAIRQARERLVPFIKDRRLRLEVAEVEVEKAAKAVIASSSVVSAIMDRLPGLLAETVRLRSALSLVAGCMPPRSAAWSAVTDLTFDSGRSRGKRAQGREYVLRPYLGRWRALFGAPSRVPLHDGRMAARGG
jgi:hypothetical protein